MNNSFRIFIQLLKRDLYVAKKHIGTYLINYTILNTAVSSFAFCYLQATTFFGTTNSKATTTLFVGNVCLTLFVLAYKKIIPLLYDLDGDRFISYQITMLNPRLVLLERIIFTSFFTFFLILPFFPISKLIVQDRLNTDATSWPLVIGMLAAASFMCSAYNVFIACFLKKPAQLTQLWARCNIPMLVISGWVPWYIMLNFSSLFAYALLANPMLYVTDGIRHAFLNDNKFLPVGICLIALFIWTCIFTLLAWHYFKKRVDHI